MYDYRSFNDDFRLHDVSGEMRVIVNNTVERM
jgi:hypothetical protein